jgi:hypothetical protein
MDPMLDGRFSPARLRQPVLEGVADGLRAAGHARLGEDVDLAPLVQWAAGAAIELEALTVTRPSLEDVYLQLTEEPA